MAPLVHLNETECKLLLLILKYQIQLMILVDISQVNPSYHGNAMG